MAWTTLDTNNLLAGEPLVEQETLAFYENPIAIADGAAGAPRIQAAGIGTGQVPLNKFSQISAGTSIRARSDAPLTVNRTTAYGNIFGLPVVQSGSVRLSLAHRTEGSGNSRILFSRIRAGVTTDIAFFDTGSFPTYTNVQADIPCIPGDFLVIRQASSNAFGTDVGSVNRRASVSVGQSFIPIDNQGFYEGNP